MTTNARQVASPPTAVARSVRPTATPVPAILPGPLDGLPTARVVALRRPIAVVEDNFVPDALPQPGLMKASVVFETVVEGGLTRLLAIYLEHGAAAVGPIRSARPYLVTWSAGYHALFVHVGGSPASEHLLSRTHGIANLDATFPGGGFIRLPGRVSPHDLYGSTSGIRGLAHRYHWDTRESYAWLPHKQPANIGLRGGVQNIDIDFSSPAATSPSAYAVRWSYDPQRNVYLRFMGDSPFDDRDTGQQIAASNVVVLFADIRAIPHDRQGRVTVNAIGRGEATYFRDGHSIHGHWVKLSAAGPLSLQDDRGQPVPLDPGPTWVEVTAPGGLRTGA